MTMDLSAVYDVLAKERGMTVDEVKTEMQAAISGAYANAPDEAAAYQRSVPCKGSVPTPDELLRFLATEIKSSLER